MWNGGAQAPLRCVATDFDKVHHIHAAWKRRLRQPLEPDSWCRKRTSLLSGSFPARSPHLRGKSTQRNNCPAQVLVRPHETEASSFLRSQFGSSREPNTRLEFPVAVFQPSLRQSPPSSPHHDSCEISLILINDKLCKILLATLPDARVLIAGNGVQDKLQPRGERETIFCWAGRRQCLPTQNRTEKQIGYMDRISPSSQRTTLGKTPTNKILEATIAKHAHAKQEMGQPAAEQEAESAKVVNQGREDTQLLGAIESHRGP